MIKIGTIHLFIDPNLNHYLEKTNKRHNDRNRTISKMFLCKYALLYNIAY